MNDANSSNCSMPETTNSFESGDVPSQSTSRTTYFASTLVGLAIAAGAIILMNQGRVDAKPDTKSTNNQSTTNKQNSSPTADASTESSGSAESKKKTEELVATFAGGCFWCTEAVFEPMNGVNEVVSGYIGGRVKNPTYKAVCTGRTGHAEAVEIYYDPAKITFEEMLEIFFKTHDPTTLNRQGADVGTQYRSSVFVHNEEQKKAVEAYIKKANKERKFGAPVVTRIEKASKFYPAEEYHQDYFARNPFAGYCRAVVATKVKKAKNLFGDKLKENQPSSGSGSGSTRLPSIFD